MLGSYQSPSSALRRSLPRQLYTPRQREHIINLHRLRLMFILCERAARDKPIKNRIYCSLKATRKVITKFQRRAHCLPICVRWKRDGRRCEGDSFQYPSQSSFPSRGGNGRRLTSATAPDSTQQEEALLHQWPWLTPFK